MASEYIQSSSKNFYRSDPDPRNYPLKAKYRVGGSAPRHNKHSDNQGKNRHKIANPTSYAAPRVMVMDLRKGAKTVMMSRQEFADLDWGWEIKDRINR